MSDRAEASSRFPWPPAIYGIGFLVAAAFGWLMPLPFLGDTLVLAGRVGGGLTVIAAIAVTLAAEREFQRAHTPALPTLPTRSVVDKGVYAYSRNPMYIGFTGVLVGLGLAGNSVWFLIAAAVAVLAVTKLAIEPEEAYLARKFGETYRAYKARVRRWV